MQHCHWSARLEMGPLYDKTVLLVALVFIAQVNGSPFYWSQPDCDQQPSDSYGVPSYQDTMRDMVEETIRAICDIMRITARAAKQELAEIAKIFYRHYQRKACTEEPVGGYPGESVGEIYITTLEPQTETTPSNSMVEDKFGNANESSTEPTRTTKLPPTLSTTEQNIQGSTKLPTSTIHFNNSTSTSVEGNELTTIPSTTTGDPLTDTTTIEETTDSTTSTS